MNPREQDGRALYLYCVGDAAAWADPAWAGIDEQLRPQVLAADGLSAVVGEVPLSDFCGPDAERRLEDLEWMSERALRHERVVEAAMACGPALPMRFGTLFSSVEALRRFVRANREAIGGFLEIARGHEEWGVRGFLDRAAASAWVAANSQTAANNDSPSSPGLRYLRERRAQAAASSELHQWTENVCTAAVESIRGCAEEWRSRKVIDAGGNGAPEAILNAAVLLRRGRADELLARIDAINRTRRAQGFSLAATGPWPLYSFCPQLEAPR